MAILTNFDWFHDVVAKSSGAWCMNGIPIIINLITFDTVDCFIQLEVEEQAEDWNGFEDAKLFCDDFNKLHKTSFPYTENGIQRINNIIESITNDWDAKFEWDEYEVYGNLF